ncbi:MAG: phosphotransferase enzyme family protein, partial [bacterium]
MEETLKKLFAERFGENAQNIVPLEGDASARKLFRIKGGTRSVIGVVNADRRENAAFLEFSRHFRGAGLPVPEIYAKDPDKNIYLEEDLGDITLFGHLSRNRTGSGFPEASLEIYRKAVKILPRFQIKAGKTLDYSFCHPR